MRLSKKGQLTIFVIIGIVIVAGIVGYFVVTGVGGGEENALTPELSSAKDNILDCYRNLDTVIIEITGMQGGYYSSVEGPREEYEDGTFIPYHSYNFNSFIPSLVRIEEEIAKGIDDNVDYCLDDSDFTLLGLEYGTSKSDVKISHGKVSVVTNLDLNFIKGEKRYLVKLGDYQRIVESNYFDMYSIAKFINEERDDICLTCVLEMAEESDLNVDFMNFDESNLKEMIVISDYSEEQYPSSLEFLNKIPEVISDEV
jgi:hypothetical protein